MKKYNITILCYYNNSDGTHQTSIVCDGIKYSQAGCYEFWVNKDDTYEVIAYYPIRHTIITSIEQLKSKSWTPKDDKPYDWFNEEYAMEQFKNQYKSK